MITVTADPNGYLRESNITNNTATATISITTSKVNVLSYGDGA